MFGGQVSLSGPGGAREDLEVNYQQTFKILIKCFHCNIL